MPRKGFEITIRVKTQQIIIEEAEDENYLPLRQWEVQLCMINQKGEEVPANLLANCTYYLHKTFEKPIQKIEESPFLISEQGWGEFDMKIVCKFVGKSGKFSILHDLTFEEPAYAVDYLVQVPVYIPRLRHVLEETFTLPADIDEPLKVKKPSINWNASILSFDEDMITEFTQIILNDPAVKAEISRHDKSEKVHLYFGQFPEELLNKLIDYSKTTKSSNKDQTLKNDSSDDDIDIFGDRIV